MAITYKFTDALNIVGKRFPKALEDEFATVASNMTLNKIWDAHDWRESLKRLPPFYLIPNEQDHGPPEPIVPTDFQGLRKAQIIESTGYAWEPGLSIVQSLDETYIQAIPKTIAYLPEKRAFRFFPRILDSWSAPNYWIRGQYKRLPTLVTNSTLDTELPFDDKYFQTWIEGLRWAFLSLDGQPTAGQVQVQNGQFIYTGQLAAFMAAIEAMADNEGLNQGESKIAPKEPLVRLRGRW